MIGEQISWPQALDYLAEIGAAGDLSAFGLKAVRELDRLVPYDAACLFQAEIQPAQINKFQAFNLPERIIHDYLNYYAEISGNC